MVFRMKLTDNKNLVAAYIKACECPICKKTMIVKEKHAWYDNSIFPFGFDMNQDAQIKDTGIVYQSDMKVDDKYICIECSEQGKATFLCALCEERKTTDKEQESFGDPPEYLCSDCYSSVSAKSWDDKCEELRKEHRYDFE